MKFGNLKKLRERLGMTQEEFAASLGLSKTTYNNYETGVRDPKSAFWKKVASKYDVTIDYLLGLVSEEEFYLNYSHVEEVSSNNETALSFSRAAYHVARAYEKATPPVQRTVEVALEPFMDGPAKKKVYVAKNDEMEIDVIIYDQPAAAGLGNYLDGAEYVKIGFPKRIVPRGTDFAVRISGDSMTPDIRDGGLVFVKSQPVIENGQTGIFVLDGNSYCKELKIDRGNKQVRLVSRNPKYSDIIISNENDLRTVGRVLGYTELK